MTTDAELKALAERAREAAADNGHCGEGMMERRDRHAFQDATLSDFRRHATPDRILSLLTDKAALADKVQGLEADLRTLLALLDEQREALPPISMDGPHAINAHRVWLARQLLDSKLSDAEAYGIVAHSPAISDHRRAAAPDLYEAAQMLASLEHEDGGRSFPTKEQCAFARAALEKADALTVDGLGKTL